MRCNEVACPHGCSRVLKAHEENKCTVAVLREHFMLPDAPPSTLKEIKPRTWDCKTDKLDVPPGVELVLGDVRGGSKTPGMVKRVLHWRATKSAEANELWSKIAKFNGTIEACFSALTEQHAADANAYDAARQYCASHPHSEVE